MDAVECFVASFAGGECLGSAEYSLNRSGAFTEDFVGRGGDVLRL